jgi:hypothetical protein
MFSSQVKQVFLQVLFPDRKHKNHWVPNPGYVGDGLFPDWAFTISFESVMYILVLAWRRITPFLRRLGCYPLMTSCVSGWCSTCWCKLYISAQGGLPALHITNSITQWPALCEQVVSLWTSSSRMIWGVSTWWLISYWWERCWIHASSSVMQCCRHLFP